MNDSTGGNTGTAAQATHIGRPLTQSEVEQWLALWGLTPEQMGGDIVRKHIESLNDCLSDRQLRKTLGWISDALGQKGFASDITCTQLQDEVAQARAKAEEPSAEAAKGSEKTAEPGEAAKKAEKPAAEAAKGTEPGEQALEAAKPASPDASGTTADSGLLEPSSPRSPHKGSKVLIWLVLLGVVGGIIVATVFGIGLLKRRSGKVAAQSGPMLGVEQPQATGPPEATAGASKSAEQPAGMKLTCVNWTGLRDCNPLPSGCREGHTDKSPTRLTVTCPGGTWIDGKDMNSYQTNARVQVHLTRQ